MQLELLYPRRTRFAPLWKSYYLNLNSILTFRTGKSTPPKETPDAIKHSPAGKPAYSLLAFRRIAMMCASF